MACSSRNLLINGGFRRGLAPWTGKHIQRTKNPLKKNDWSVKMNADRGAAVLKQKVNGPFEQGCAYYLHFRSYNITPTGQKAVLFATVSYLDAGGRIIRSTPMQIILPEGKQAKWFSYFTIVPPPPQNAKSLSVVFWLTSGSLFVDYIRIASHSV